MSTDDEEAARIARDMGCEVPFMRPPELAGDDTPHLPVMQHAVAWMRDRQHYEPEWVMILMPTSPLRQPRHIRRIVALAVERQADSVVSVDEMPAHFHPMRAVKVDADGWATLFVGDRPVRQRPGGARACRARGCSTARSTCSGRALLFDAVEPSLYGNRVAAYVMPPPYRQQHRRCGRLGAGRAAG